MLNCQKDLFTLDPEVHYINGAYMSPQLKSVEQAGMEALLRKRSPNRISPSDFFTETETLRGLFARLVHAPAADQVGIIPSVSYGMAVVAKNLKTRAGQNIVVAEAQFPSNVYPWLQLAEEKGLSIKFVPMPAEAAGRGKRWNELILEAIDERTAMVSIGHIHWATGTVFNLKMIGEAVHRHGGLLVVDGTQSVGALPMDVQAFGIDALVCAGYKWLLGPYSLGYAWFGKTFEQGSPLEENWINRQGSENFAGLVNYQPEYQPGARRFDVGERSNFVLVPMAIKALEQLLEWGAEHIQTYCKALTQAPVEQWRANGYVVDDQEFRASHLFGIQTPAGLNNAELQQRLRERNIWVSVRGDFIRIAPNVYNDGTDLAALTEVLLK
ncbi:MAG: aminotransferase class V-fold PLP-dependent enzyme [Saprospiraceae bacterium]|nr:aminotransferase class V-fold PLP-dependent enzyme [Saprospiraceae bacterium]